MKKPGKPFDMPTHLGRILQAAGVEDTSPEEAGGMLFGALAFLFVGISTQYPDHWPTFRAAFIEAADDLRDVLTSDNPRSTVEGIMARQKRDKAAGGVTRLGL